LPRDASRRQARGPPPRRRRYRSRIDVETAIRTRRTHKAFEPKPISREEIDDLLELASWAPNHHLTAPWRFRVLGALTGDAEQDEEDLHATAVACYIVLLGAHAHGLAGYWRTPGVLREQAGRTAVGLPDGERFVGLLHLGYPIQQQRVPERPAAAETTIYLG